ncbi:MAG: hypothetical protein B7C24_09770 [Bacteroidetes bacterium 4572_77]|nr:MAG: hypothetical protein B7C24_09770 [Bacteroidetes bacterium 4572_77]
MKRLLIVALLLVVSCASLFAQGYSGGDGTEGNPYQIGTTGDLIDLTQTSGDWDKHFILTADITFDATEENVDWDDDGTASWDAEDKLGLLPIGTVGNHFTGTFDGQDFTISNLYINRPSQNYVALFSYTDESTIENIGVVDCEITGNNIVAGLVGNNFSSNISNSYVSGSVTGIGDVVGGLVGSNSASSISDSYAMGTAIGSGNYVGGLVGRNNSASSISTCYATNIVTSTGIYIGGLVGNNSASSPISDSYATGLVTGSNDVGGFVGYNTGSEINDSYAMGDVERSSGTDISFGAFCGMSASSSKIKHCYSIGSVDCGGATNKGFVGSNSGGVHTYNFFDSEASNQNTDASGAAMPKSTTNMKNVATYTTAPVNWDFTTTWCIDSKLNSGYPIHIWDDNANPIISILNPADDATGVAIDANLVITFDEDITAGSGNVVLYDSEDNIIESFDVTSDVSIIDATVTINPSTDLTDDTEYYVQIATTCFEDLVGNAFLGIADKTTWNFKTIDITNPTISTLSPADDATGVAVDANLVIIFDENIIAGSGEVVLYDSEDNIIETFDVTSDVSISVDTVTINPTNNLTYETDCYVKIANTCFEDLAGNAFAGISYASVWSFQTIIDITNPIISTFSPADDATGVAIDANLVITFDENIVAGSGNVVLYDSNDNTIETFDVSSDVSISNTSVTINPSIELIDEAYYYVQIANTCFEDLAGNAFAGISNSTDWSFQITYINPAISILSPADNAIGVAVNADLVLTFDEDVVLGSGNVVLYDSEDNIVETFDVTSDVSISNATVTINPSNDLSNETDYYVQIANTCFKDLAGNAFVGISDKTTWSFKTIDITNPTISTLSPTDDAISVAVNADLVLTFDEDVVAGSGNVVLYDSEDNIVETFDVTSDVSISNATVTINPSIYLIDETDYYVQIGNTCFEDLAGNAFAGISNSTDWSFHTLITHRIELSAGWNLISSYISLENNDIEDICNSLSNLLVVKDGNGSIYLPPTYDFINTWTDGEAYQIYVTATDTLLVQGAPISQDFENNLPSAWNMFAYTCSREQSIATALNSISSNILVVKDPNGKIYIPGSYNFIGNMKPGEGYRAYLINASNLVYPVPPVNKPIANHSIYTTRFEKPSINNETVILNGNIADDIEIIAYNNDNLLVGSGKFENGEAVIVLYGDDEFTDEIDGAIEGEAIKFTSKKNNQSFEQEVILSKIEDLISGTSYSNLKYSTDGFIKATIETEITTTNSDAITVIPNPINRGSTVNIAFETVYLDYTVKFYDASGNLTIEANTSSIQIPDTISAGAYFIVIESNGEIIGREKIIIE